MYFILINYVLGEKPYACKFCERSFAQSNDLIKHLRSHVGEKVYQCEKCQSSFRLHSELRAHNQEHFKKEKAQSQQEDNPETNPNSIKIIFENETEINVEHFNGADE